MRALVVGGSGHVGAAVVRELARRAIPTTFTHHRGVDRARDLAAATGARAEALDLASDAAEARLAALAAERPTHLVYAAGALGPPTLAASDVGSASEPWTVGPKGALATARAVAGGMRAAGGGSIVFVTALDRGQTLPLPPAFAAAQGALGALAMALAKELGPEAVRVNAVCLGPLDGGLAASLPPRLLDDYTTFSGLRRRGTAAEAAQAIGWLLCDATFVTGRTVAVNGGL